MAFCSLSDAEHRKLTESSEQQRVFEGGRLNRDRADARARQSEADEHQQE